jgi:nucleotide-binding universal stress UspA family protein
VYNRGGEASYGTQDAAIALAKKRGDTLVFIYVADVGFLNQSAAPLVVDVYQRLVKLGQFQLAMAQERAAAQNVVDQTVVRRGQLRTELVNVAQEIGATLIVLGRPIEPTAFFAETALQEFVADLQTETGIEARILDDE